MIAANRKWLPRFASKTLVTAGADAIARQLKPARAAKKRKKPAKKAKRK